jgi:hypothetical protein
MWRIVTKQGKTIDGPPEAIVRAMRVEMDMDFPDDRAYMLAVAYHLRRIWNIRVDARTPEGFLQSLADAHALALEQTA